MPEFDRKEVNTEAVDAPASFFVKSLVDILVNM